MSQLSAREYQRIARAALTHYPVEVEHLHFLQQNAGVTFRVDSRQGPHSFLLKIHVPVGTGTRASPETIRARYAWLRALSKTTGLDVQTPIPNQQGNLLTNVSDPLVADSKNQQPYLCTLQQWVDGTWPGGDYTATQVQDIGTMMARLHHFSSEWDELTALVDVLPVFGQVDFEQNVQTLYLAVDAGLLTKDDFALIEVATQIIENVWEKIGHDRQHWGPIHGDFHHGNLLFDQGEVRLIDFDSLCLSPYALDLATMLYHTYYQGPMIYSALLQGYQSVRPLPFETNAALEAFVTQAAMTNLAFQVTIPEQYELPSLSRNLRQLVDEFCHNLVTNTPFLEL